MGVAVQLTIVGGGETEGTLKQLVQELDLTAEITFLGQVGDREKNDALRRAHFLIHTSVREGWGLNVIEANAMGAPAAVYPVAGLVDSTIDNVTGIVTKNESPENMAECFASILKEPGKYNSLRVQAWKRSALFTWENVLPPAVDWLEQQAGKTVGREMAGKANS